MPSVNTFRPKRNGWHLLNVIKIKSSIPQVLLSKTNPFNYRYHDIISDGLSDSTENRLFQCIKWWQLLVQYPREIFYQETLARLAFVFGPRASNPIYELTKCNYSFISQFQRQLRFFVMNHNIPLFAYEHFRTKQIFRTFILVISSNFTVLFRSPLSTIRSFSPPDL